MKNQKNGEIEFLRAFFCVEVILLHYSTILLGKQVQQGALVSCEFFFILSGYFMAKKYLSHDKKYSALEIANHTTKYISGFYFRYFPYVFSALVLYYGVNIILCPDRVNFELNTLLDNIFGAFLLDASGWGLVLFAPTWFISSLFLSKFIILPIMLHYGKIYSTIIAPISSILILGWVYRIGGCFQYNLPQGMAFLPTNLFRGIAAVNIGIVVFEVTEKLNTIDLTKFAKTILRIVKAASFISILILFEAYSFNKVDFATFLLIMILVISVLCTKSESKLFNNPLVYKLGELSLPIYIFQDVGIIVINKIVIENPILRVMTYVCVMTVVVLAMQGIIQKIIPRITKKLYIEEAPREMSNR